MSRITRTLIVLNYLLINKISDLQKWLRLENNGHPALSTLTILIFLKVLQHALLPYQTLPNYM